MNKKKSNNGNQATKPMRPQRPGRQRNSTNAKQQKPKQNQPQTRRRGRRRTNNRATNVSPILTDTDSSSDLPTSVSKHNLGEKRIKQYSVVGADARDPFERVKSFNSEFVAGQTGSIPYQLVLSDEAIRAYAVGCVTTAVAMGWRATLETSQASYPFWAAQYIMSLMYNVANGNDSQLPTLLPAFFRDTLAIIKPKSNSRFYSGELAFKWLTSTSIPALNPDFPFPVGAGRYSYWIVKIGGSTLDGFPEMAIPISPVGEQTSVAFNSLVNYCANSTVRAEGQYNPWVASTSILSKSMLYGDTSGFAVSVPQIGQACGQSAFQSGLLHPKRLYNPKFSVFANNTTPDQLVGWREAKNYSGDACSLVTSLMLQVHASEYSNADSPSFKYLDFYDILNRLLVSLSAAWSAMYRNSTNTNLPLNFGMTATQFILMFRAVLLGYYNYQHYGHSILPIRSNSSDPSKIMLPLISSCATVNGYPYATMSMPLYIIENLKALMISAVEDQFNPRNNKTVLKHKHFRIPVLFVYKDAMFDWTAYTYSTPDGAVNMFTAAGANISVVDGSSSNLFYDISDSANINALLGLYNTVFNAISPCIQQPATTDTDPAPNALTLIQTTRFVDAYKRNGDMDRVLTDGYTIGAIDKTGKTPTLVLKNKGYIAYIAEQPFLRALFGVSGVWWSPELPLFDGETGTGFGKIVVDSMRVYYRESFYATLTNTAQGSTIRPLAMSSIVLSYSNNCFKSYNAEDGEAVKLLLAVSEMGEGGFFMDVVKRFAIPAAKAAGASVAQELARILQS